MQEHAKLPKVFVHDPPLAGFAQLSVPSAHSSMSVVPMHCGLMKSYFKNAVSLKIKTVVRFERIRSNIL